MRHTAIFTLFILFLYGLPALAQQESGYHIQQFTTDNGMPSNGIKSMQWDEANGFLWIATEAGMSRYNGLDFTNFTKENTPGLSHERMSYVVKNYTGTIIAADVSGNLVRVNGNSLLPFPDTVKIPGFKKRYYVNTLGSKVVKKVRQLIKETNNDPWDRLFIGADSSVLIVDSRRNYFYSASGDETFHPLKFDKKIIREFMVGQQIFFMDENKKIWKPENGYTALVPVTLHSDNQELTPGADFFLYWDNGMENPIAFSGSNAWLISYEDGALHASLLCPVIPPYSFIRFAQYSKKNRLLFLGTDSKGIIIINENRVNSVKKKNIDRRERNAYYSQVELAGGNVLTNEGHIIGNGPVPDRLPINGKFNFTIFRHGDSLWFAQGNATFKNITLLHCYNYKTGETVVYDKIPPIQESFAMEVMDGKFYLATNKGLSRFEGDSLRPLFLPAGERDNQAAPYTMQVFSPGVLGVASCDGLILYDTRSLKTDTLIHTPGFCIRSLWKYKDYMFIGSYGKGYYIWKDGKLKNMPRDKNNFLLYTHCFVPDTAGFCWMSTNRGLFKAQLSDLIDAFEHNGTQIYYHYYGKNDGMDITEMNGGCAPCAIQLQNQTISFPTMDGLLWVNSDNARPLLPEGNVFVDQFMAGSRSISPDSLSLVSISPNAQDILIRIGFSAWCNKENVYLDYQLNGRNEWIPVDVNNGAIIKLSNLQPGNYRLMIRKMNGFGVGNYSYKEIRFTISTPWYQQWWFYLLSILFITGAISLYFNYRTRQYSIRQRKLEEQVAEKTKELQEQNELLEKNNSIKTRLISIISHDIVTPLKFLNVAGKNLIEKRKLMSEDLQVETLKEITNTSQELQLLSTNILNWIKYQNENRRLVKENFNLHEMVAQLLGLLQSLARQKKLIILNNVAPELEIHQYYEPLKILIYNLLTNAIHFTEKGAIVVSAIKENGHITVSVKDEGIGMSPEQIQRLMAEEVVITSANVDNKKGHGLGYLIIKDLLKTMDAKLHIDSKKGEGATVSIQINL
jgi:signal transduction histidine kinase